MSVPIRKIYPQLVITCPRCTSRRRRAVLFKVRLGPDPDQEIEDKCERCGQLYRYTRANGLEPVAGKGARAA